MPKMALEDVFQHNLSEFVFFDPSECIGSNKKYFLMAKVSRDNTKRKY